MRIRRWRKKALRFILEIEMPERLPVVVADDEAGVVMLFDDPRRQEAARAKRTPPRRIC
jgi:hypothetical protein